VSADWATGDYDNRIGWKGVSDCEGVVTAVWLAASTSIRVKK
jgi:hypothetical protein